MKKEEEEHEEENVARQKIKSLINVRIYLNTIKNAYKAIKEYGIHAEYKEADKVGHVEVVIKIPKY